MQYVYFVSAEGAGLIKIGRTKNVAQRLDMIATHCPYPVKLVQAVEVSADLVGELEFMIQGDFCECRSKGEWYELSEQTVTTYLSHHELQDKDSEQIRDWIIGRDLVWLRDVDKPTKDYLVYE